MERPKWLTALPREYVLGWRSQVGALASITVDRTGFGEYRVTLPREAP